MFSTKYTTRVNFIRNGTFIWEVPLYSRSIKRLQSLKTEQFLNSNFPRDRQRVIRVWRAVRWRCLGEPAPYYGENVNMVESSLPHWKGAERSAGQYRFGPVLGMVTLPWPVTSWSSGSVHWGSRTTPNPSSTTVTTIWKYVSKSVIPTWMRSVSWTRRTDSDSCSQ